ncbi:Asp-tRNA(Asn)/Glu-tRNA(Gln) amidotransferase subunit GatC [Candidatus Finniella inopinata]|uniref:Aspartyl/glutamyl-tRNA(Asn/Gln) amidotransferase subunit C n=1 Tax=Candidatus Finniella inopinata TaxID=1696036 RepID=A0A4Q7DH18_9PROT|nr:Asp-tRNA(Asn)/Glu-tRNA(Gln) amidotransferase subunit GatC [Candidatus Finniella inopinata]RZI45399.1 Asp-tRNA(Asn)/Glu-tRNA(Gln) amidotransferase subunit GatC [Candidatus Finniella inopinata]
MSLTQKDIKKIAELARIKIDETEIDNIAQQLSGIMDWIDQLRNVDTSSVDNIPHPSSYMQEREDVVTETNQVEAILANAPVSKHQMFVVPKMVE